MTASPSSSNTASPSSAKTGSLIVILFIFSKLEDAFFFHHFHI